MRGCAPAWSSSSNGWRSWRQRSDQRRERWLGNCQLHMVSPESYEIGLMPNMLDTSGRRCWSNGQTLADAKSKIYFRRYCWIRASGGYYRGNLADYRGLV